MTLHINNRTTSEQILTRHRNCEQTCKTYVNIILIRFSVRYYKQQEGLWSYVRETNSSKLDESFFWCHIFSNVLVGEYETVSHVYETKVHKTSKLILFYFIHTNLCSYRETFMVCLNIHISVFNTSLVNERSFE